MSEKNEDKKNWIKIMVNNLIGKYSVDMPEVTKEEAYEANQKDSSEDPIVASAEVQCTNMLNKNTKVIVFLNSPTYDERNGEMGIRDIDIILVPNTFGYCNELQKFCQPLIEEVQWQGCDTANLIGDRPSVTMISYMVCTNGCGIITPVTDGQKAGMDTSNEELAKQAYETMQKWLLEGGNIVSQEDLLAAMDILAIYGEQSTISNLNVIADKTIEQEGDELRKKMFSRINASILRQSQYDNMILAWTNYWNLSMKNQYGENYSPIRADVVKAMLVVESNMGEENNKNNVVANNQRDIKQSLDPRNPVFWTVLGVNGNGRVITIEYAKEDAKELNLPQNSDPIVLNMSDGGAGDRNFFGNGSWTAVHELISEDYTTYYAENVTPELSLAVGEGLYSKFLNGAGGNGGTSIMRDEYTAIDKYNGGGDPNYLDKVNIVLENMGVDLLEKKTN